MINGSECLGMLVLAGEQAAPNLLTVRHFKPDQVIILHTSLPRSKAMADNLALCLNGVTTRMGQVNDYDVAEIRNQVLALLGGLPSALVNITGGTKPMSIGALDAARSAGVQAFYVRSQGNRTEIDLYGFDNAGAPFVSGIVKLEGTISLDDYLISYFGSTWKLTGFGKGSGELFERVLYDTLFPSVDEIKSGWRDASNQVELDFVIRCNNQIGIIQAKTGNKAGSIEGIEQLAIAGGQRFFGTYVKRFLVIDRLWQKNEDKLRRLCDSMGIILVELPGFASSGEIAGTEKEKLLFDIHKVMGKPVKLDVEPKP
jgi:hypothetical protein